MQIFIRGCANQFQFAPAGAQAWATGAGPADPVQLGLSVTLTANSAGDVTVNGSVQSLPYLVQSGDVFSGIGQSGGAMTFMVSPDDDAADVQAVSGVDEFPLSISGSNPSTVIVTSLDVPGPGSTDVSISASKDDCVSAVVRVEVDI